ncbi:unnamed protein product [Owenia fusiformis]|uniref:Uncharacterized protein n=1 Tax=Owenia fusiformis TaxID=6347 RepID=A0A8S4PNG6_OWEFU|nr:unnamed protein product [Owenia fusiformis]
MPCSRTFMKIGMTTALIGFISLFGMFLWTEKAHMTTQRAMRYTTKINITRKALTPVIYMPNDCPMNITLFTVFHEGLQTKETLQNNTLLNWMHLQRHCVTPVFYSNNSGDILAGGEYFGWQHHPLSPNLMVHNNIIMRELFIETFNRHNSDFYMFAYADLLFHGEALFNTLSAVKDYIKAAKLTRFLLSGTRYEALFHNNSLNLSRTLRFGNDLEIMRNLQGRMKRLDITRLGYIITGKDSFPWEAVPDLVVTTLAPDNPLTNFWFLMYANKLNITTFDISNTVFSMRQAGLLPDKTEKRHRLATKLNEYIFLKSFQKYCFYKTALHSHRVPSIATTNCFQKKPLKTKDGKIIIGNIKTYSNQKCKYKYPIMIPMVQQGDNFW